MEAQISNSQREIFFKHFPTESPIKLMVFMFFTASLYLIFWLYSMNLKLEKIDPDAPDSRRGAVILFFMPITGAIVLTVFELFFFPKFTNEVRILSLFFWSFIGFLSLNYVYDFCRSFSKVTNTSWNQWYFFIFPGYISFILFFFEFYYMIPLLFFPAAAVPAMQNVINNIAESIKKRSNADHLNFTAPKEVH